MEFKDIIEKLIKCKKTISTMESCIGGGIANKITNIEGASEVFKFGAVTYSNEFKIKLGVSKDIIDKYTVYSREVADEMSLNICNYTGSDYGIGVTGKLKRIDENNLYGENDEVFISIYDANNDRFFNDSVKVLYDNRIDNKEFVIGKILDILNDIIK